MVDARATRPLRPPTPWLERPPFALAFVVCIVTVCVLLDWLLYPAVSESDLVMVLLVGVLLVARLSSRGAALLAAVVGVAAFDVLFVEPRFTFAVAESRYLITFAVMTATGFVLATTTARLRRQARRAWERSQQLQALNDLARSLAGLEDLAAVDEAVRHHIVPTIGRDVRLVLDTAAPPEPGTQTLSIGPRAFLVVATAGTTERREDEETLRLLAGQLAVTLERIEAATARQAAELEAERERLRTALLSSVSHDLRTPLGAIVGAASTLLQQESSPSPQARVELLQTIRDEADRLGRLVDNLLHMTRIEGGVAARRDWEAPEELVASVFERLRPRATGYTLQARLSPEPALVPCDATLVELILLNLVENALTHTPPGTTIELRGQLHAEDGAETYVLEVADDGPGVPEEDRERIFDKFMQRAAPSSRSVGLGLAICRAAARAHGGDAVALAGPGGRGLVVRVMLPYEPVPPEPMPSPP